jgi:hypothetical protein
VARKGAIRVALGGEKTTVKLPKASARLIAGIDGRRDLAAIAAGAGLDPIAFGTAWGPVERALTSYGLLHYSSLFKG